MLARNQCGFGLRLAGIAGLIGLAGAVACSAGSDENLFENGGGGAAGVGGAGGGLGGFAADGGTVFDTGYTGDGELDPDGACATTSLQAEEVPLDMYFMLDTSGSMGSSAKIQALRDGVSNFIRDPQSAGIGAAAQHFPIPQNSDPFNETCDASRYATPTVPWGVLPYPQLEAWVQSLNADGYTPTAPALWGAADACRARLAAEPGHKCLVVLVTDGKPEGNCPPTGSAAEGPVGNIAAAALADGIPVFAIGFPGLDNVGTAVLNAIASNGGTGAPVIIQSGNVGQDFIDALTDIRGVALGCEYKMPTSDTGTINPDLVKVEYTPGGGTTPEELPRKTSKTDCATGDGWYYDDNANPTRVVMCPGTCDRMQGDDTGKVDILLGCTSNQR